MNIFKSFLVSTTFFVSSFVNAQFCNAAFTRTVSGNTVTFSNTSLFTPSSTPVFLWDFGNGLTYTTISTSTTSVTYTANGFYVAMLYCGSAAYYDTLSISIPGCPLSLGVVDNNTTNGYSSNPIVSFSANAIGTTSNTTFLWDFDDGNISTVLNPTHTYSLNGRYHYSVTATENPTCIALFAYNGYNFNCDIIICSHTPTVSRTQSLGGNVSFTINGFDPSSNPPPFFHWSFGDSQFGFAEGLQVNHVFFTGTYSTVLTIQPVSFSPFCSGTSSTAVITVSNNPCIVNSVFTSTLGLGGSVQFSPNVAPSGSNIAYSWDFGDGVISNAFNPTHTYVNAGTYSVSLMSYNVTNSYVCQQTNTANVVVTGIPCSANSGFSLFPNVYQLHDYYIVPNYPYNVSSAIWNWGDGSSSNILYTGHTYSASGNYNICLTVTVSCNGTSSTCVNQFLAKQEALDMLSVTVQAPALSTNINTQKMIESGVGLFPNPNDGMFYIESESPILLSDVKIVDMMGKEVNALSIIAEENRYKLKIGSVDNGVYFITIKTDQKNFRSRLIISK